MKVLSFLWKWTKAAAKSVGNLILRYPLAAALTVLLVAAAVFAAAGGRTLQIGGILDRLWGRKRENARGVPPPDRRNESGEPIEPGEPDEKGWTQAPVSTEIEKPGILSNPDTVTVVHPEKGRVTVDLPTGVKNKDVREVVEIRPDVYEVRRNDRGVDPDKVLDALEGRK